MRDDSCSECAECYLSEERRAQRRAQRKRGRGRGQRWWRTGRLRQRQKDGRRAQGRTAARSRKATTGEGPRSRQDVASYGMARAEQDGRAYHLLQLHHASSASASLLLRSSVLFAPALLSSFLRCGRAACVRRCRGRGGSEVAAGHLSILRKRNHLAHNAVVHDAEGCVLSHELGGGFSGVARREPDFGCETHSDHVRQQLLHRRHNVSCVARIGSVDSILGGLPSQASLPSHQQLRVPRPRPASTTSRPPLHHPRTQPRALRKS